MTSPIHNTDDIVIKDQQIQLSNGISAQVLSSFPSKQQQQDQQQPPLIFLHGSFHASWCWAENYFGYFTALGYPVVALSWRGTSGTPAGEGVTKVKAEEHGQDLQGFLDQLPFILGKPYYTDNGSKQLPVLVSHSFGGIVVMKFLQDKYQNQHQTAPNELFSGIISACSVPPSGNGKMTMRFLWRSLSQSYKITKGFAMKQALTDPVLCRELFFGGVPEPPREDGTMVNDDYGVSEQDLIRYQGYFKRDTNATIDVMDLAKNLPSKYVDKEGRAPFVADLPPCLVIGAKDDFIVDREGTLETAKYYGLDEPVIVDSPHDVMLGAKWKNTAQVIHNWVQENVVVTKEK